MGGKRKLGGHEQVMCFTNERRYWIDWSTRFAGDVKLYVFSAPCEHKEKGGERGL
jgi:hypothetical protein